MLFSVFSTFFTTVVLILNNSGHVCGVSSDSCDWLGSGLQHPSGEVQPLYLRCTAGRVRWVYPRGALRALLRPPLNRPFKGCIRAKGRGARLFLEGKGRLLPLKGRAGEGQEAERCFYSNKGHQVALYVEADPPIDPLRKDILEFSYDLVPRDNVNDDMEECRPCSDEELLKWYCTSDFIIEGTVSALSHNESTQTSELTVLPTAVRSRHPSIKKGAPQVVLRRPLRCGTAAPQGAFLFLGRWRLGQPSVRCAPRLTHWTKVRETALRKGTNLCSLD